MMNALPRTPPDVPGYEITRLIGLGGMGEVYLARQLTLNRPVAIKFLTSGAGGPSDEYELRFKREAELMAQVSHPNIVMIFDFGTAQGRPYLVMEYVEEGDLRSRMVPDVPMKVDEIRAIVRPVTRALEHLHRRGIVHRDMKPENILMYHEEIPKVTDFGIAVIDIAIGSLTRTGLSLGTPGYISPEQQYGLKVDERADQFSLAALCYEMATGRKSLGSYPPRRCKLNPGLGKAAGAAILQGLSDDPADRFPTIAAFGEALERGLSPSGSSEAPLGRRVAIACRPSRWSSPCLTFDRGLFGDLSDPGQAGPPPVAGKPDPSIPGPDLDLDPAAAAGPPDPAGGPVGRPDPRARFPPASSGWARPDGRSRPPCPTNSRGISGQDHASVLPRARPRSRSSSFAAFVEATKLPDDGRDERPGGRDLSTSRLKASGSIEARARTGEIPGVSPQFDDEPVVQVSWDDAVAFCEWLSRVEGRPFRLPTEAEWEYACRARTDTRWSTGDDPDSLQEFAWTLKNAGGSFHKVGSKRPNPFGLHDMHGNAWEWCSDRFAEYGAAAVVDPEGPPSGEARVLRGGSFDWDKVERTRSASRHAYPQYLPYYNYGFRVCSPAGP